jgi:hypothetical protein
MSSILMAAYPIFWGLFCSRSAFSAPVVSVFMLLFLRDAKKLRVIAAFLGSLTAADYGTFIISR